MATSNRKTKDEEGQPLVIFRKESGKYRLQHKNLEKILCRDDVRDHPVMILSIVGALREGKSFILNFIIRYLRCLQVQADWLGDESSSLDGFSWKGGLAANTMGILMWSEPFLIDTDDGKVAVILMDTQGLFDNESTRDEVKTIFCMSFLLCSFQVYNVMKQIKDDMMQCFMTFLEYAKMAKSPGKHHLLLQRLLFLIRDWPNEATHRYGPTGGEKYLQEYLNSRVSFASVSSRSNLKNAAEKVSCFLLPSPGRRVCETRQNQAPFRGALKDIDKTFLATLPELMKLLFCLENIVPKTLKGQVLSGKGVMAYAICLDELFSKDELPKAEDIATTIKLAFYGTLKENILKRFRKEMDKVFEAGAADEESFLANGEEVFKNLLTTYDGIPKYEGEDEEQTREEIYRILRKELEVYVQKNRNRMLVHARMGVDLLIVQKILKIHNLLTEATSKEDTRKQCLTLAVKQCESNEMQLRKKFDGVCVMPSDLEKFCDDITMTTICPEVVRNTALEDDFYLLVVEEMQWVKEQMLNRNDVKLRDLEATCRRMKSECERFAEEEMEKELQSHVFSANDIPRYKKDIMFTTLMHWDTLEVHKCGPKEMIDKQKKSLVDSLETILCNFGAKNQLNKERLDKEASQEVDTILEEYKALMAKQMGRNSHERKNVEKFHVKSCDVMTKLLKDRALKPYTKEKAKQLWDQKVQHALEEILHQNSVKEQAERQRCEIVKVECIKKAESLLEEECRNKFFTDNELNDRVYRIEKKVLRKFNNDCPTKRPTIFAVTKIMLEYYLNKGFLEHARERNQKNRKYMEEEVEAYSHDMETECGRIFTKMLDGNEPDLSKVKKVEECVRGVFVQMIDKCSLSAKNRCIDVAGDIFQSELAKYKVRKQQLEDDKQAAARDLTSKCLNTYRRLMRKCMLKSNVSSSHGKALDEVEKILYQSSDSLHYHVRVQVYMEILESKKNFLEAERLKEEKVVSAKRTLSTLFRSSMENKLYGAACSESQLEQYEFEVLEGVEKQRKRMNVELGVSIKQLLAPEMREIRKMNEAKNKRTKETYARKLETARNKYHATMSSHIIGKCCHDLREKHMPTKRDLQSTDSSIERVNKSRQFFQDFKDKRDQMLDQLFIEYNNKNDRKQNERAKCYRELVEHCLDRYKAEIQKAGKDATPANWFWTDSENFERQHAQIRSDHIRGIEEKMPPKGCPPCHICRREYTASFISKMDEEYQENDKRVVVLLLAKAKQEYHRIMNKHKFTARCECCHDLKERNMQTKRHLQNAYSCRGVNKTSQSFQNYKDEMDRMIQKLFIQYDNENDREQKQRERSYAYLVDDCLRRYEMECKELKRSVTERRFLAARNVRNFENHLISIKRAHIKEMERRMPPDRCSECHICRRKYILDLSSRMDEFQEHLVAEFRKNDRTYGGWRLFTS